MEMANLVVFVYDNTIANPIPDANVRITSPDGTIKTAVTDANGKTVPIALQTPDRTLSLTPDPPSSPFDLYTVEVSKPGYKTATVRNVRMYGGEGAQQDVILSSSSVTSSVPTNIILDSERIDIQPQKIPESDIKSTPRVLTNVVVPEYVVVHDGDKYNYSAPNYTVPFVDYIKNVASNEIYSTWDEDALKANILAIISITLSRVYTEWYPSNGYNYTITSSTQYDQKWKYGSTIYDSISRVVDEIFDQYIQKNSYNQPYFSQYNNGRILNNPGWLSQWGSQELAQQGYSYLDILRYYYGNDIYIKTADKANGLPYSYPDSPLGNGDCSAYVQTIQNQINTIRSSYPGIPKISKPNGLYGQETEEAVRVFQEVFGLPVTGITDRATWYKISLVYIAIAGLLKMQAENPTEQQLKTLISIEPDNGKENLKLGSNGELVKHLQTQLKQLGFYDGEIDGLFGRGTSNAVKAFQISAKVAASGSVDPVTWGALNLEYAPLTACASPEPPSPPGGGSNFQYTVKSGDTLWALAKRFGTTVDEIKRINGLTSDSLSIDQILWIPNEDSGDNNNSGGGSFDYTVKSGDTLWALAKLFGTTVSAIKSLNGLTSDNLSIGQVLKIPNGGSGDINGIPYTVRYGDSLWLISQKFGVTVDHIRQKNKLTSDILQVGQLIYI
jgi:LysM repeat protein